MFYKWTEQNGLVVLLSWVYDCLCTQNNTGVREAKEQFMMWAPEKSMCIAKLAMIEETRESS